jgi:uncharacterized membrane protein YeaQ/YmgE (transglycosylase-associated protein family)
MEFLLSIDSVICIIVGAIVGALASKVIKGFGLPGNAAIGAVGGLIGGLVVDKLDFMDVGDFADPAISGVMGSVIVMAIVGLYLHLQNQ